MDILIDPNPTKPNELNYFKHILERSRVVLGITILLAVLNANTKQSNIKTQEIRIQKISLSSWDDILPLLNLLLAFFKVP